ncbi:MAG: HAD-IIIA family hydrolase [Kiritimatiellae bacterium]|nr:HAD-IIIA family hydrolase [Kiritimatiellia bacterium]
MKMKKSEENLSILKSNKRNNVLSTPCIFFDRDGVVNESPGPGYVESIEDFHIQEGFISALRVVKEYEHHAIIVTNQRGVAREIVAMEEIENMHRFLQKQVKKEGLDILDIFICPHNHGTCSCRKPQPGMLLKAADKHDLDLPNSWMIGDSETDIQAGQQAGCKTIFVGSPSASTEADYSIDGMSQLADFLKTYLPR